MSEAVFRVAYEGEAVSDGEMDVADLAPALLALGQLMKAAGRVVDGPEAEVTVRVRATQHACFEVWLSVDVAEQAGRAWAWWKTDDVQAANALVGALFLGGGSLVWLVKRLGGRKPKRRALEGGMVALEADGVSYEVPAAVADLYEDAAVRSAAEDAIADPLERDGIDAVVFGPRGAEQRVEKAEADWFKAPAMEAGDEFISRHTKAFSFVTLSFKPGQKWRLSDGGTPRSVTMSDKEFLGRVDRNEVAFRKSDLLICEVIETARRTAGGFKNDYEIVRVIEHRKAVPHPDLLDGVPPHASGKDDEPSA